MTKVRQHDDRKKLETLNKCNIQRQIMRMNLMYVRMYEYVCMVDLVYRANKEREHEREKINR